VIGWVDDPDPTKAAHLGVLREVAHLRPRTNVIGAATRLRRSLASAIHRFFGENGFFWVNTPIITASDAEGRRQCSGCRPWILPICRARQTARSISRRISWAARRF